MVAHRVEHIETIATALRVLLEPDSVAELRILAPRGTVSGYFNDRSILAESVARRDGKAPVYVTLNPVVPALLNRAVNRLIERPRATTGDNDILRRRWLPIDFDPVRPSGISATNEEKEKALDRSGDARAWLRSQGWPEPVVADSGNGGHLLYLIDQPNDDASRDLLRRCLEALAFRFNDETVKVDAANFNASRIWKLYGTIACKGDNTPERPHRRSKMLHVPDPIQLVPRDRLEALAAMLPQAPPAERKAASGQPFDLERWLAEHALPVSRVGAWGGGRRWVLSVCPWNPEHTDRAAYIVQFPNGAIAAGCHHNACRGKGWHELRDAVEPGWRDRRRPVAAALIGANEGPEPELWEPPVPFSQAELPAFPADTFPEWLRSFVLAEAEATQTPPDLAAMLCLSVLATAAAKKVVVRVKDGWIEPVNLFTVTVLPPGNRKSGVFQDVVRPLEDYEEQEARRMEPLIREAANLQKITEAQLQRLQSEAARAKEPAEQKRLVEEAARVARQLAQIEVPARPRLVADDATPEKLASLLRDQGGRMAVLSAEGDVFDIMAGRYSQNGDPNLGVYLRGHSGDTLRVDRIGRPAEYVRGPALTLGLAIQPAVLRGLFHRQGLRGRGLLARFSYSLPVSLLGRRRLDAPPVPAAVRTAYEVNVGYLLTLPYGTDGESQNAPHVLTLGDAARQRLLEFMEWLEPQLAPDGELGMITDWAGKLAGAIARIAGLLHLAAHAGDDAPWESPISLSVVEDAIRIGQYALDHAKAAFAEMGADEAIEDARYVLDFITKKGLERFSKQEIWQITKGRFKQVEGLDRAQELLVTHGYLRAYQPPDKGGAGRKPAPSYEVNPLAAPYNSYNPYNPAHAAAAASDEANSRDSRNCRQQDSGLTFAGDGDAGRGDTAPEPATVEEVDEI